MSTVLVTATFIIYFFQINTGPEPVSLATKSFKKVQWQRCRKMLFSLIAISQCKWKCRSSFLLVRTENVISLCVSMWLSVLKRCHVYKAVHTKTCFISSLHWLFPETYPVSFFIQSSLACRSRFVLCVIVLLSSQV